MSCPSLPPPSTGKRLPTRRTALAGLGAASAATTLGACSAGGNVAAGADTLTFWSSARGTQQVVEAWNASNPAFTVQFDAVPSGGAGGSAKLSNAARAGNAPDIVSMEYSDLPQFALDGVASDITDLVSPTFRDRMLEQAWDTTTFQGRTYATPLDIEPMIFLNRVDLLNDNGLEAPTTWDEFAEAARVLKEGPGVDLATFFSNGYPYLAGFAQQLGAQWFDISEDAWVVDFLDEPTLQVADYWQGLIDDDLLQVAPQSSQQWLAALANGSTAGFIVGSWGAANLITSVPGGAGKWQASPLPQWDTANPGLGVQGGTVHVITQDSTKRDQAIEFLEWMSTTPEGITARLASGTSSTFPAAPDLWDVSAEQLDTSYYNGQDLYALSAGQSELLGTGWVWGPRMQATGASIQNGLARLEYGTTIAEAIEQGQAETLPDMRSLGLEVRTA